MSEIYGQLLKKKEELNNHPATLYYRIFFQADNLTLTWLKSNNYKAPHLIGSVEHLSIQPQTDTLHNYIYKYT